MDVRDILVSALRAVDEANINGELRQVAFSKAIDLLAKAASPAESRQHTRPEPGTAPAGPSADNPLDRLAAKLKVDHDSVCNVYDIDGGEFHIVVSPGKIDRKASTGTKELALLVAAGRQAAGFEDWTSFDEIRRWAEEFKRLDSANFASSLKEMQNDFVFRGSGRKRQVRLSRPGWEKAAEFVKQLGNGGEA